MKHLETKTEVHISKAQFYFTDIQTGHSKHGIYIYKELVYVSLPWYVGRYKSFWGVWGNIATVLAGGFSIWTETKTKTSRKIL